MNHLQQRQREARGGGDFGRKRMDDIQLTLDFLLTHTSQALSIMGIQLFLLRDAGLVAVSSGVVG